MGKDVVIKGIVMQEVGEGEKQGPYKMKTGEKEYCVYAEGKQAIRDMIFIRKGQHVIVEGEERKNEVLSKKSKIMLEKRGKECESASRRK